MNVQRELTSFLRQQLFRERNEPIALIELRHAASGSKGNAVDDFDFSSINTDNFSSLVDEIISRGQSDADGIGGVQRYELHVLTSDKKVSARFAFRLRGEDDANDEIAGDEAATMKGLLGQLMRHNEQQNRTMVSGIGVMVNMMNRSLERLQDENESLREERSKTWEIIDKARGNEHEREMELLETSRKGEREDMIFQKINTLFPLLLNRLSGKKVLSTEEKSVLGGFVESLTEDQFNNIKNALNPEQQILLFKVVSEINQKQLSNGKS